MALPWYEAGGWVKADKKICQNLRSSHKLFAAEPRAVTIASRSRTTRCASCGRKVLLPRLRFLPFPLFPLQWGRIKISN
jgi:hypothetical protein